jgi:hypothetical protein
MVLKVHGAEDEEEEEASSVQKSGPNPGASVGVQRLKKKETPAYTHEKSKEVEIKIEGQQTQRKAVSECDEQNGKLPIGKKDMRKRDPRPPRFMRGRDGPIAKEYSPKLTLEDFSKVRHKGGGTVVTNQMRVLTESM